MALEIPEHVKKLQPYVPGKPIEETKRELGLTHVIKLASNENPLGPGPKALEAIRESAGEVHRYPDSVAFHLKMALAESLDVPADWIVVGNGSDEVFSLMINAICVPGDAVVTSKAAFSAYKIRSNTLGIHCFETELTPDLRFDVNAIYDVVESNPNVKMVFIANPNNPTGTYVTTDELTGFIQRVNQIPSRDVLIVLDYAYWEYRMTDDLPDPMDLLGRFPNIVVTRSFSKIHGLGGLRIGYGITRPSLIEFFNRVRLPFNVNSVGMAAAQAAIADRGFISKSIDLNAEEKEFWYKALNRLEVPFWKSQGNFVLVDAKKGFGRSGTDIFKSCLKEGVIFRPVVNYGLPDLLRITFGTRDENKAGIKALEKEKKRG